MPNKVAALPVKPLEPWCDGSNERVSFTPKNHHARCPLCSRIIPIVDGRFQHHRNIPLENRIALSG